jgi:hypothetical protein
MVEATESPTPASDYDKSEIARLKRHIAELQAQLNRKNATEPPSIRSQAVPASPLFVSKVDLQQDIAILCDSRSNLTDLTNNLKSMADRRTVLLNHGKMVDIVSAGLLSVDEAEARLELYRSIMYKFHPLLEIPSTISVRELQQTQPFLLNSVMSITNTLDTTSTDLDRSLLIDNFAIQSISVEVMVAGSKTVELVKSVLLLCLWYNSPELFRQRRYHLLNSISVTLLHDLGIIVRPTYSFKNSARTIVELDPKEVSLEYQSLVLILYSTTVSICLMLRRSIYVKWTPYVEECCVNLEVSNVQKWKDIALFLRLSSLLEKIHQVIHTTNLTAKHTSSSAIIIAELQKLLSAAKVKIQPNDHSNLAYYHSIEAYLHEPNFNGVLNEYGDADGTKLTHNAILSISVCTSSCLNALWEYSKLSPLEVATIPLIYASRIIYTAGMLLRLRYLILSFPSHIEKDLTPHSAITAIHTVNRLIEQASIEYPFNHFLKKTRLVVQLFIQTYATQVQELLRKNGQTPQNLRPYPNTDQDCEDMNKLLHLFSHEKDAGQCNSSTDSGSGQSAVPLDLLSYAASYRRDSVGDSAGSEARKPMQEQQDNPQLLQMTNPTVAENTSNTVAPLTQSTVNGNSEINPMMYNGMNRNHPGADNPRANSLQGQNQPFDFSKIANSDLIETSYLSVTDEFWADLLSNDANKINFSNNTINPQSTDEVFFMG